MLIRSRVAQIKFGSRKGKVVKRPALGNIDGSDTDGLAQRPPMAGPMIVPIDHTKGITVYARAVNVSSTAF